MLSESQNIEYKESWRDEYLKWICGFANAHGGRIYIGVNDNKEVIGLPDAKKLMEDIPNKIVNYLGIVEDVNLLTEGEKEYIEIVVAPSNMPIAYKGTYHYRSGSTKQELKGLALQNFILKKMGWSWDDMPVFGVTLDNIDREAIDLFPAQRYCGGTYFWRRICFIHRGCAEKSELENRGWTTQASCLVALRQKSETFLRLL